MVSDLGNQDWALVVGHPGHELRAFHFLERTQPLVSVLTDGSGSTAIPRLDDTSSLLERAGAQRDRIYGRFSDPDAYAHLVSGDPSAFIDTAHQLRDSFLQHGITAVLTDAAEGYNPVHDLCRGIAEAAVRLCGSRAPRLFEVDLVGHPDGSGTGIRLVLDDDAFARKLAAIERYPALKAEAVTAFDRHGAAAFRTEFLRRSVFGEMPPPEHVPYYEQVGNERVRTGLYRSVLRYGEHVRPVLAALQSSSGARVTGDAVHP